MVLKETVKRMIGRNGRLLVRRLRTKRWRITEEYRRLLHDRRCLEIGGPSDILGFGGPLPLYSCLAAIDNCNFATETIWSSEAVTFSRTFVSEASALQIADGSYDCVIASHCLEHIANPIQALQEWKRVLRPHGLLLLILPHRDHTFDWRRPVTTLEHMQRDYELNTPESDLTHLDEILSLHDLSRDPGRCTPEQFRERSLINFKVRALHHHVFVPETAWKIIEKGGFSVIRQDVEISHIVTLAKKT
jgi:SAM-dependent methyltransferase